MPLGALIAGGIAAMNSGSQRRNVRLGHSLDNEYSLSKEATLYGRAKERGLTPQEYYGSSAPGSPGVSGGAQVLGNSQNQKDLANTRIMADAASKAADRTLIKRGQDTQKEVAKIQAGTQTRGQDISSETSRYATDVNALIKNKQIRINQQTLNTILIPAAAAQLQKTEQEILIKINEVTTSTPKWRRKETLLKMGVDNTIQTALLNRFGKDITDPDAMSKLSEKEFQNMLAVMVASGSIANREMQGFMANATGFVDALFGSKTQQYSTEPIGSNKPTLGGTQNQKNKKPQKKLRGYYSN